jgi:hypothetical protein
VFAFRRQRIVDGRLGMPRRPHRGDIGIQHISAAPRSETPVRAVDGQHPVADTGRKSSLHARILPVISRAKLGNLAFAETSQAVALAVLTAAPLPPRESRSRECGSSSLGSSCQPGELGPNSSSAGSEETPQPTTAPLKAGGLHSRPEDCTRGRRTALEAGGLGGNRSPSASLCHRAEFLLGGDSPRRFGGVGRNEAISKRASTTERDTAFRSATEGTKIGS